MAHGPSPRLGPVLATLYAVGAFGFLIGAFFFAVSESESSRPEMLHTVSGAVVVVSWLILVAAAVLTLLRPRDSGDPE